MATTTLQPEKLVYSVKEAAALLGASEDLIYRASLDKRFPPARRIGRKVLVSKAALEEWLRLGGELK